MTLFGLNFLFVFSIFIATLSGIEGDIGTAQMIALLRSMNNTSTNVSLTILPQLKNALMSQENLHIVTNLLLENSTAAADEMVKILKHQLATGQNEVVALLQRQQDNHGETATLLQNQQQTLTQMSATQSQMAQTQTLAAATSQSQIIALLQSQQDNHNETIALLQNQQQTLTQMAATQTQMTQTQSQMAATETQAAASQSQIVTLLQGQQDNHNETITLLQNQQQTLIQVSATQTQIANTIGQVVTLLQSQNQQLQNMASIMNSVWSSLTNQETPLRENPRDCLDLASRGNFPTGPYTITIREGIRYDVNVYCDMVTDGGGWTVFQRRFDGTTNFYRSWYYYENGFGNTYREFWAGLKMLHRLTKSGSWVLRVDLEDFEGNVAYAFYDSFRIGDAASSYTLNIGSYSGTAGDSMASAYSLNNMQFTTNDRDNDARSRYLSGSSNCAELRQGAWWYRDCGWSNLNGRYLGPSGNDGHRGMGWYHWKNSWQSLKKSEMKIKRIQ